MRGGGLRLRLDEMIADIIPKIASEYFKEKQGEKPFYPRPSSAGPERCIRQMVYHGLNIPPAPLPGRAVLVFDDSSWHEELTAEWIRKSAFHLHSEQMEVDCRPPMKTGEIDGIITDVLQVDRLLEHKAINHFTFQRFWDNSELPEDYLAQCAIYAEGLQKVNPEIHKCVLLVKNKNTAQYMEYELEYDQQVDSLKILQKTRSTGEIITINEIRHDIIQKACDKFDKILEYIEKKTLPKRQYDIDHWRCEYCGWHKKCWENYEKEFNELKTAQMLPEEIADMVQHYKELSEQKKNIEDEYDNLRAQIKTIMKENNSRDGIAGKYTCRFKLYKTSKIDKSLLTEKEIERAKKTGFSERLFISKRKEEKTNA